MHVKPADLLAVADRLDPKARAIALDMASRASQFGGFTQKQQLFAARLIAQANGTRVERAPGGVNLGDPAALFAVFQAADRHVQSDNGTRRLPATIRVTAAGHRLKLRLLSAGRDAGSVVVMLPDELVETKEWGPKPRRLGFVRPNGDWNAGWNVHQHPALMPAMKVVANLMRDPVAFAARYTAHQLKLAEAQREAGLEVAVTANCIFCGRPLHGNDGRSLAVGYGQDCAERWGLPWGHVKVATHQGVDLGAAAQAALQARQEPAQEAPAPEPLHPVLEAHAARLKGESRQHPVFANSKAPWVEEQGDDLDDIFNA